MLKKIDVLIIAILVTLLISCIKKDITEPEIINFTRTPLSGKEFTFDSLSWVHLVDYPWEEIYIRTPDRPELFTNDATMYNYGEFKAKIFLKFDTAFNWIEIKSNRYYDPALSEQYVYHIRPPYLVVNVIPTRHLLIGRLAGIKVKFL